MALVELVSPRTTLVVVITLASCFAWVSQPSAGCQRYGSGKKPSISLKANPPVGFSPLRVHVVAEFRGGDDDYADYYCPSIEWDWGDGTVSENSVDCDPYEAGKSEIRR